MSYVATNHAVARLAAGIAAGDTSITLEAGKGALYPVIAAPDYTFVTLEAGTVREIVKVTARAGGSDTMTIVRGQEGTSAIAWSAGDTVALRPTAGVMTGKGGLADPNDWSAPQYQTPTADNDLSFDLSVKNDFTCTPTAGGTLTFTNIVAGKRGNIYLNNTANYSIAKAATVKCPANMLTSISATGEYWLSYWSPDGTNVLLSFAGALAA